MDLNKKLKKTQDKNFIKNENPKKFFLGLDFKK